MAFGKRDMARDATPPSSLTRPIVDTDGVARALPKSTWDGPHGGLLRELGLTPDDPSNLVPTEQIMQARADAARTQREAFLARVNSQLAGHLQVGAWEMIPGACWGGPHAKFLMGVCEYYPSQPWNTFLLPTNDRAAFAYNLPKLPEELPEHLVSGANEHIGSYEKEWAGAYEVLSRRLAAGDHDAAMEHARAVKTAKDQIVLLAHTLASMAFGEQAYFRHLEVWGRTLGWDFADALLAGRAGGR